MANTLRTARDLLDSTAAPTDSDPLVVLVLYIGLTVVCVLGLGATVAVTMPYLDRPGSFALALLVGFPLAFALPGVLMRRAERFLGRRQ
ncbi:hypothetical protein [Haloprofundus salinisoli]|uniref:hypothetical protein n=1 Tax=Haloprofundus salinisoli TaxID=2876193 RepID=UPI001CCABCC9|nr:hypothetical protein [Haloprofundus salinisoli]